MIHFRHNPIQTLRAVGLIIGVLLVQSCSEESPPSLSETPPIQQVNGGNTEAPLPEILFTDVTEEMGIDFIYENGATGNKWFPESMLGGVGFIDYNDDGYEDLVAVRGRDWDSSNRASSKQSIAIFRNNKGESFTDVTSELGLDFQDYAMGLAVGDFDGDGWVDIYITVFGKNRLLKNMEGEYFSDVTEKFNVGGNEYDFTVTAAFFDADNDGDLDLFVGNYLDWSVDKNNAINSTYDGKTPLYPHPNSFSGTTSILYRNEYPEAFLDVSDVTGIARNPETNSEYKGKALGVIPIDLNDDDYLDLIIANDSIRNFAFVNDGNGNFTEVADKLGLSHNNLGLPTAAMGIDSAWIGPDLDLHIAMGNFRSEMTSVYRYEAAGIFSDIAPLLGIGAATRNAFTFGLLFLDLDLDGRQDFIQVNGDVEPDVARLQKSMSYSQLPQIFWQCESDCSRKFMELDSKAMGDLGQPLVGRGLASADFDHDGDLDLAASSIEGNLLLFRNDQATSNHWLRIKLDNTGSNRLAIGATVEITHDGKRQRQSLMPTSSYVSQSEAVITFGLGDSEFVEKIVVTWPGGQNQVIENAEADQVLIVTRDN